MLLLSIRMIGIIHTGIPQEYWNTGIPEKNIPSPQEEESNTADQNTLIKKTKNKTKKYECTSHIYIYTYM